jgi:hypothetical protein
MPVLPQTADEYVFATCPDVSIHPGAIGGAHRLDL